jgi:hypothetical protein
MTKSEREYIKVLHSSGVKVLEQRRAKHTILKCLGPSGNHFNLCIPSSPSDVRGIKNFKSKVAAHCHKGEKNGTQSFMV